MAINKIAKNLNIEIRNHYSSSAKIIYETSGKIVIVATKENLSLISGKKINIKGNKS